ncbi:DEAD box protein (nucleomorph) [Chroomonas mesostigmatica CCMP1168]|uniref:DEAD box protein n=1 Tax=Chroomonas mesostigmatica CCMP1168 TaxID=1195612 RepID=J7G9X4_9CRYP|nr:DEAD box protein [Chroomonas mesostigmatica CCMP1168]|mmetsp:Transcript_25622/g.63132  ORF Transcript_25622/g.63132 Transcript_25622/m.63132 type:complete len:399 (+) Transcript_25622:58-1254(+)
MVTFKDLGICEQLNRITVSLGYKKPTKIQIFTIPHALNKKDIIGYAQTGSGKTIAYLLPIVQNLIIRKSIFNSLIIVPARELAFQIASHFEAFGNIFGIRIAVVVGGINAGPQKALIFMNPHILISTPGRLVDHLAKTIKLKLDKISIFVLDEADRLLHLDFKKEFLIILSELSRTKQSFLFSATMTSKIEKLQKNFMKAPVKIEIHQKYKAVKTLIQNYIFIPRKFKEIYFVFLCNEFIGSSILAFVDTQKYAEKITLLVKLLGFKGGCIHGGLKQSKRFENLHKFKLGEIKLLIATDLAARGLDIPCVDLVINFDLPSFAKEYIHRVGRTARAGNSGRAINLITQYDVSSCQKIESLIGEKFIELKYNPKFVLEIEKTVLETKKKVDSFLRNLTND